MALTAPAPAHGRGHPALSTGLDNPSAVYHAVWSRDLYEIVTALIADGDLAGAGRALDYLFNLQQKPDGSFPQNSFVNGTPHWGGLQLDEVGDPIILAYQLGRNMPPSALSWLLWLLATCPATRVELETSLI